MLAYASLHTLSRALADVWCDSFPRSRSSPNRGFATTPSITDSREIRLCETIRSSRILSCTRHSANSRSSGTISPERQVCGGCVGSRERHFTSLGEVLHKTRSIPIYESPEGVQCSVARITQGWDYKEEYRGNAYITASLGRTSSPTVFRANGI